MDLDSRYPALSDLRARARRRIPHFVWEFLDSGTGSEATLRANRAALDRVGFMPSILHGEIDPDPSATVLGRERPLPVGIAPLAMSGLVWPDAEGILARAATAAGIPYTLSTVATQTPEEVGPHLEGRGWFHVYPPRDPGIRADMLARAADSGFDTLVLTVDVPAASRRERQIRGGLRQPPRITPRLLAQVATRPAWALATARRGMPRMKLVEGYAGALLQGGERSSTAHVGYLMRTSPDWDYLAWLRDNWQGPLVVKGVLDARDVPRLEAAGIDAIWVSNHAGRQFDAAPAAIDVLPAVRAATTLPVIFDSGVEGGLDILRAVALGADLVMLGRAWHFAVAALGEDGPAHLLDILRKDMVANMHQLGAARLADLPNRLLPRP